MEKTFHTESSSLLISKKAYNDFSERIRQTLGAIAIRPDSLAEAINLFDRYVKGETSDLDSTNNMVKLALMMLRPEIDKAMHRSSAARERARLRREKSTLSSISSFEPGITESQNRSESALTTIEQPMNRRKRREYKQELARKQRRYERRMKRMKN